MLRAAALALLLVLGSAAWAAADSVERLAQLPGGRFAASSAWDGGRMWVLGGYPPTDEVVAYNPATGEVPSSPRGCPRRAGPPRPR